MIKLKFNGQEKKVYFTIFGIFFLILGFGLIIEGCFPKTIKIEPTATGINAHIIRTDSLILPPFKKFDYVVANIKQAVIIKTDRIKHKQYLVELETYDDNKAQIPYDFLTYSSKEKLINQINESIQNRTPFTKTYIEVLTLLYGLFFVAAGFFLLFLKKIVAKINELSDR